MFYLIYSMLYLLLVLTATPFLNYLVNLNYESYHCNLVPGSLPMFYLTCHTTLRQTLLFVNTVIPTKLPS